jgi:hypothetical protein
MVIFLIISGSLVRGVVCTPAVQLAWHTEQQSEQQNISFTHFRSTYLSKFLDLISHHNIESSIQPFTNMAENLEEGEWVELVRSEQVTASSTVHS